MEGVRRSAGTFPLMVLLAAILWATATTASAAVIGMELASTGSYGQAIDDSFAARISATGQFAVFESGGATLISPAAPPGVPQIYLKERGRTGLTRLSVNVLGGAPSMPSHTPALDADGDAVVFVSDASDLVTSTPGPGTYVRYPAYGITVRVDVRPDGSASTTAVASQSMWYPNITPDGNFVVFMSRDTLLVPGGGNGLIQVYRRDLRSGGATVKVSCDAAGVEGNAHSGYPSISDDGRYVVFSSGSTNLITPDVNNSHDVFLKDLKDGSITRVSVDSSETQALGGGSLFPVISGDGTHVAFVSDATTLVSDDTNAVRDVFVRDLIATTTTRISVSNSGAQGAWASYNPGISRDGRIVSFQSDADTLVDGSGYYGALFIWDSLATNKLTRVPAAFDFGGSVSVAGGYTSLSANGRYVAFGAKPASDKSSALVSGGTNGLRHVFLYDMGAPKAGAILTTPRLSLSSPHHNAYFNASGSVTRHSGAKAKVQLKFYRWSKTLGRYVYYKTYTTYTATNGTAYKTRLRLPYTGKWRVRAYHPEDSRHLLSWSIYYRYFTVRT